MKRLEYKQLGEYLYHEQLENGLDVYILPKDGFHKTFATFTTKYGSVDDTFVPLGKDEPIKVPDGIAHFLEHKMFEDEDGDVFHTFGEQGASSNAFTSFTRTAYLFSSTTQVEKNVKTLLDFVQKPYFTDETVEKEKGIIAQEITMYDDNPDWRAYFGTIENLFEKHPVKIDIAGTIPSITEITKEDLYTCYETFYHPSNMLLFIVGPVDPEVMMTLVRENQAAKTFPAPEDIVRHVAPETTPVHVATRTISMPVQTPKCFVGYKEKEPTRQGTDLLRHELAVKVVLDLMFSPSSKAYESLYEAGDIDDSFSFDYTAEWGFGFSIIGGDSNNPDRLAERITETIEAHQKDGLCKEEADRAIKKKIGAFLRSLNSPDFIANEFTRYQFNGMNLFDVVPTLETLTLDDLQTVLTAHFTADYQTICIVRDEGK
ncbi:EF-P 5-aminopentanol modification-associated protein YfmH [Shouchella lonarensis]|uniref:Predicted Zn-dependent peptidase n=1 Tax=Shouchella lonarensis TaxID=1464122 RepID=A0A1G6LK23_9BACI|nr:pitrilysin family protein [Shouchella lonarensis]SDC43581.1 Predicted Zn-dependent peptidase [Shouchella lonarensis]